MLKTFINALLQKTLITDVYKVLSNNIACDSEAQGKEMPSCSLLVFFLSFMR